MKLKTTASATVLTFLLTNISFADDSISVKEYKNYAYSIIENRLGVDKSDLAKNTQGLKDLESYIKNCIDMDVDINEFKSMLDKEIEASVRGKVSIENINSSKDEKEVSENITYEEGSKIARDIVVDDYNVNPDKLSNSKFRSYVLSIIDKYNLTDKKESFNEFFEDNFDDIFYKYDKKEKIFNIIEVIFLVLFTVIVVIGFVNLFSF